MWNVERAMIQDSPSQDAFLDHIASGLSRRGLRLPALIALDAGQPLAFVVGQLLWVCQPVLSLFLPADTIGGFARLLEEPASVAALIARLEAGES